MDLEDLALELSPIWWDFAAVQMDLASVAVRVEDLEVQLDLD